MANRLIVVLLTLTVGIQMLILYKQRETVQPPPTRSAVEAIADRGLVLSVKDAPRLGRRDARVAIIEFADFECPFCRQHADRVLPLLRKRFIDQGSAAYYYIHLPLINIHPHAADAARAAACAGDQGRFWELHDRLFAVTEPTSFRPDFLRTLAASLQLDLKAFDSCVSNAAERIASDVAQANRLGINATPAFVIGTLNANDTVALSTRINGARSVDVFEKAILELQSPKRTARN